MACRQSPIRGFPVLRPRAPNRDARVTLRQLRQCASPDVQQRRAYLAQHKSEFLADGDEPAATRRLLPAQFLAVVTPPASALRRRQFAVGAPGKKPGFHVVVVYIVVRFHLLVSLPDFGQHPLLVSHVRFDRIGDQEVRTASRGLRQLGKPSLDLWLQSNAKRAATCVRHEHIITDEGKRS